MSECKSKGCYSILRDLVHKARFFKNGGSRNTEARGDLYFGSHVSKH